MSIKQKKTHVCLRLQDGSENFYLHTNIINYMAGLNMSLGKEKRSDIDCYVSAPIIVFPH